MRLSTQSQHDELLLLVLLCITSLIYRSIERGCAIDNRKYMEVSRNKLRSLVLQLAALHLPVFQEVFKPIISIYI